jgi:hypothetical protein
MPNGSNRLAFLDEDWFFKKQYEYILWASKNAHVRSVLQKHL